MQDEEELLVTSLKRNNKIRRAVERKLRGALRKITEHNDQLFVELCETENAKNAELAIQEIWERGGLNCSPNDYTAIVDLTVKALRPTSNTRNAESQSINNFYQPMNNVTVDYQDA